jgi:hypothetical protein
MAANKLHIALYNDLMMTARAAGDTPLTDHTGPHNPTGSVSIVTDTAASYVGFQHTTRTNAI